MFKKFPTLSSLNIGLDKGSILDNFIIIIPRSAVEQWDYSYILRYFPKFRDEALIKKTRNKFTISFDGYNDDPREIYEIWNIRYYIQVVTSMFPYWFYYINLTDDCLFLLLCAISTIKKVGPGKVEIDQESHKNTMVMLFDNLNKFYANHDFPEAELDSLSEQIGEYFYNKSSTKT